MGLEAWNTALQFGSAILLGLTFVVGAGAIFTSYTLGNRQAEKLVMLETELAKQRERAAVAERSLLELQERARPRTISPARRQLLLRQI